MENYYILVSNGKILIFFYLILDLNVKRGNLMTNENKWFNKKWWVSPFNYSENVLKSFNLP
jgi:hypothetical protein